MARIPEPLPLLPETKPYDDEIDWVRFVIMNLSMGTGTLAFVAIHVLLGLSPLPFPRPRIRVLSCSYQAVADRTEFQGLELLDVLIFRLQHWAYHVAIVQAGSIHKAVEYHSRHISVFRTS